MIRPGSEAELAEAVRDASGPLSVRGGGTRGLLPEGTPLTTSGLSGIVLHDPAALTLVALAGTPVPTLAALRQDFAKLKPDALSTTAGEKSPGWLESVFGETVSVRRSDPESPAAKQLAQAEAALGAGRLGEAISTVEALPEASRALFNAWLASARQRQQLDETLSALRLKLISERP